VFIYIWIIKSVYVDVNLHNGEESGNIAATFIVSFGVVGGPEKDRLSSRVGRKVTLRQ
jgi:hypothetical protein